MKLRIAAAREGIDWLRSGARTFARQPVALIGLPLMLAALLAFVGMLPARCWRWRCCRPARWV